MITTKCKNTVIWFCFNQVLSSMGAPEPHPTCQLCSLGTWEVGEAEGLVENVCTTFDVQTRETKELELR
jgi:hypothetical protein